MRDHEINLEKSKKTVMIWAIRGGYSEVVKALIVSGMDVNMKNGEGDNLLAISCLYPVPLVTEMLLNYGASINNRNDIGWTPLLWAVDNQRTDTVKIILEYGVDIDVESEGGWTALMVAKNYKSWDIIQLLNNYKNVKEGTK